MKWRPSKTSEQSVENVETNEVSTRHDMNYGQVRYPNLVDEIINFTKTEPLFGT